jgi:hypothetical protein
MGSSGFPQPTALLPSSGGAAIQIRADLHNGSQATDNTQHSPRPDPIAAGLRVLRSPPAGGQVRLFGWYDAPRPLATGHYGHVEEEAAIIVSGRLGCSILPVRFGVPPEITVIDLG